MKVALVLMSLVCLAFANPAKERLPSFKVYRGSSRKDPAILVGFPDGHVDKMVLRRYYSNEKQSRAAAALTTCNYIGSLSNDPTACVAVTGCHGKEDLEMTILSEHASPGSMFRWYKNNTVEALRSKDEHHIDIVKSDPNIEDAVRRISVSRSARVPLPPSNLLEIKVPC